MFTIYIHILEVLAMYSDGTFADNIHAWGCCYDRKQIERALKELAKEGFVTKSKLAGVNIWHITEKAVEYCETVVKKYEDPDKDAVIKGATTIAENVASKRATEAISEDLTTPPPTNLHESEENAPKRVSELFEQITKVVGDRCDYCERMYSLSISRTDKQVTLGVVHQCHVRDYDRDLKFTMRSDNVIDDFSEFVPF